VANWKDARRRQWFIGAVVALAAILVPLACYWGGLFMAIRMFLPVGDR
jgi:hypothetical protein